MALFSSDRHDMLCSSLNKKKENGEKRQVERCSSSSHCHSFQYSCDLDRCRALADKWYPSDPSKKATEAAAEDKKNTGAASPTAASAQHAVTVPRLL
jgi:hypothetical protein